MALALQKKLSILELQHTVKSHIKTSLLKRPSIFCPKLYTCISLYIGLAIKTYTSLFVGPPGGLISRNSLYYKKGVVFPHFLQAVRFLHESGVLLHYDDSSLHLKDYYFIDPGWLCRMMAQVITVRQINPFINQDGVSFRNHYVVFCISSRTTMSLLM